MEEGYDHTCFVIDWNKMQATCPQGETSIHWFNAATATGRPTVQFIFSRTPCSVCTVRNQCTRAQRGGRHLSVHPQETYEILESARERETTQEFKILYQTRAGIEGTISQMVRSTGGRRARYRGLARTHLQHLATAAAINLQRVTSWLMGNYPETTRRSPFAALAAAI